MPSNKPGLILYFREGCHLCDDFVHELHQFIDEQPFQPVLTCVDIDREHAYFATYNTRVPVLEYAFGDQRLTVCEFYLDKQTLQVLLSQSS